MKQSFDGKVLFLDRSDINTDEIIPAKYLTEVSKQALGEHLLEDLKLDGFDPEGEPLKNSTVIISRENFGCGSSREHAPWALEVNGYNTVIAPSFARIFRQNMFNCGMLAVELPAETIDELFGLAEGEVTVEVDIEADKLKVISDQGEKEYTYSISGFDKTLVKAGGWVGYADSNY